MYSKTHVALACLGLLLGTASCDTFLTGDKLSQNPNLPTTASAQQLFVGVQAGQFAFHEDALAMIMCEWVQACSAGNSRFVQQAAQYVFNEGSFGGDWISAYDGGGLIDMRKVEALTTASGDTVWLGIEQIWEALTMGTVSTLWGDVPYSEAVSGTPNPVLDQRFVILDHLQTLLTTAIANLGKSGAGPGINDLVFQGDTAFKTKWAKVAWTLKARYYMHTAESLGTPAYTAAIAAATNGISDPTGASDMASFHTQTTSERNMWNQFQVSSGFGTDLEGGKVLIDILKARNDPRLAEYYCKATTAVWDTARYSVNAAILDPNGNMEQVTAIVDTGHNHSGHVQPTWPTTVGATTVDSQVTWTNRGLPYVGDDFNNPPPPPVSQFNCLPARFRADARIPFVSYVENELILAEAYNKTGDDANALTHLNNARAVVPLGPLAGLAGAQLLDSIMIEKYAAMFQNIESINDYRRTCIPALVPSFNTQGYQNVPGRVFYPLIERNVNSNVPTANVQLATHGFRNQGDVHACTNDNSP